MRKLIHSRGYTLVELIVAVGLFALIMTLASGAYLIMISTNQRAQAISTGIDDLSFALEIMTREIRTGTSYNCGGGGDCPNGGNSFSFTNENNEPIAYNLGGFAPNQYIQRTKNTITKSFTGPSVNISLLMFYVTGTAGTLADDYDQPHVTIVVKGTVSAGHGTPESFSVEAAATMRETDI